MPVEVEFSFSRMKGGGNLQGIYRQTQPPPLVQLPRASSPALGAGLGFRGQSQSADAPAQFFSASTLLLFWNLSLSLLPSLSGMLFRATHASYGSSYARGQIRAAAASLHHSQSNAGHLTSEARDQTQVLMDTSQVRYH